MIQPSIVLIEDNDGDVILIREALNDCGNTYNLKVFNLADEAVGYFRTLSADKRHEWPDLVLLDYNLPKMNGLEILKYLKTDENLRTIPVLIYSSSEYPKDIMNAYKQYVNSYVIKPTNIEEFCKTVETIWKYWFRTVRLPNRVSNS